MSDSKVEKEEKPEIQDAENSFSEIASVLQEALEDKAGVLLRGHTGVGKTFTIKGVADENDLVMKYFSTSTLDPFADLVGIPVPVIGENYVQYMRTPDINAAEIMFFDELNRAHQRTTNAVMEAVQFRSLNGEKLPHLQMVWAAINPYDGDYHTEEMDPALEGRFEIKIDFPHNLSPSYFARKYSKEISELCYDFWWELSAEQRIVFSPRVLDYLTDAIVKGRSYYKYTVPFDVTVLLEEFANKVKRSLSVNSIEKILENIEYYQDILEKREPHAIYEEAVKSLTMIDNIDYIPKLIELILKLPSDNLTKIIHRNDHYSYKDIREKFAILIKDPKEFVALDKRIQDKVWST